MLQVDNDKNKNPETPSHGLRMAGIFDESHWHFVKTRYKMGLREVQVAILVCRNFDNREIAQALRVEQSTVKTHLRNIYRKTGVNSRLALLLRFIEDIKDSGLAAKSPSSPINIIELKPKSSPAQEEVKKKL